MSKRGSASAALALICVVFGLSNAQTAANKCPTQANLDTLSLTLLATPAVQTASTVCTKTYNTKGACVDPAAVKTKMQAAVTWLKGRGMEAQNFAYQFANATVFYQKANKVITVTATASDAGLFSTLWSKITTFISATFNLFQQSAAWVRAIFSTNISSINTCFQGWANITNGAYCTMTTNDAFEAGSVKTTSFVTLGVDATSTGNALKTCYDLIDTYCAITHGISIKMSGLVFNVTVSTDFADGGLTKSQCTTLQTNWNNTDATVVSDRNTFLVDLFQSNFIVFVPSQASIANLGSYFTVASPDLTVKYTVVAQNNNVKGIAIVSSTATTKLNIYDAGVNSGVPVDYYSAKIFSINAVLLVLLALISRV